MWSFLLSVFAMAFLVQSTSAQDFPIEIELVAPGEAEVVSSSSSSSFESIKDSEPLRVLRPEVKKRCQVCHQTTTVGSCECHELLTQKLAVQLLKRVNQVMREASDGALRLKRSVKIRVVSRKKLKEIGGERLLGLYQDDVIWVNQDLNRRRATAIIAHELGHAWLFHHRSDIDTPSELLFEGFAEFVSYLVLQNIGDNRAARKIAQHDTSVYGRGAQRLITLQNREGLQAVLDLALTGK